MAEIKEGDEKERVNVWPGVVFCILIIAAVAGLIYVWEANKPKQPVPAESS